MTASWVGGHQGGSPAASALLGRGQQLPQASERHRFACAPPLRLWLREAPASRGCRIPSMCGRRAGGGARALARGLAGCASEEQRAHVTCLLLRG